MEKDKIVLLKEQIKIQLSMCDTVATPLVCANISSFEGYAKVEEFIINQVLINGFTIGQSVLQFEMQFNPNLLD
jgi:hypothetical protein